MRRVWSILVLAGFVLAGSAAYTAGRLPALPVQATAESDTPPEAVPAQAPATRTLYWGTRGDDVRWVQRRLRAWGYYTGSVDGIFGSRTAAAVRLFQRRNGLTVDGLVGPRTWEGLGLPMRRRPAAPRAGGATQANAHLLAQAVSAEARGETYKGQVAVAAVILNRVRHGSFPDTMAGVIYQPGAFESVSNGSIYRQPSAENLRAARDALNGWDPTNGSIYFWNPAKPVNPWVWSRRITTQIGRHVFAR